MSKVTFQDRDRGWNKLRKTLKDKRHKYVDVGVMAANDGRSDGVTNTMLAMIHEFGLGVPERSFIRDLVDYKQAAYVKLMSDLGAQVVLGRITKKQALLLVGAKVEADMKANIRANIAPANSPQTIARKGSSTPLIDTGQLVSSIDYEVGP